MLITLFATFGNQAVERLFKYVSLFLYATYEVFLLLLLTHFGNRIAVAFSDATPRGGWVTGGLTYAGYNIVAAVVILPVTRHLTDRRDAVVAGLLAGPLAMIPAMLFFVSMVAFYPQVESQLLPSDFLLGKLGFPLIRLVFQAMIFAALLESGTGGVHVINERIAQALHAGGRRELSTHARLAITGAILIGSVFVADRVGLVALIASGYRLLAYLVLALFVLPVMTYGLWRVCRRPPSAALAIET